ncbi:MAG: S8 family serine peptidase, partial [Chloroflexota bacterium]|nr:S8 family serine peptidase [Chloroflexota bacterium]
IWSVKVLDQYGNGSLSSVICGMEWVAERGDTIEVANMSLGLIVQDVGSGCTSSLVHRAVCAITSAGVTVMAAACNAGIDASTCSPGRYPEVISVSAFAEWDGKPGGKGGCRSTPDGFYGCDDRRASFSNYGPTIDIAAIGVGVYSTLFDNRYGYWSGTSMATPHVTGAAALLIAQHGDMSPANVRERLLLSAMKGPVPGDPDAYPEPIVNVASLGKGTLAMPSSARPGEQIRIRVGEVLPRTKATFTFGGREIGTATVTVNGNAYLTYRLPDLPYGKYTVTVTNERKTLTDRILVRPSLVASDREVRVGDTVSLTLRGFGANESVLITYDTGAGVRSVARVRADASGKASGTVIVPPSTAGYHRVTAADGAGHSTVVTIRTLPSLAAPSLVEAGTWLPVKLRGFSGGENVDLRWGSATGPILRTKGVTASGSGDVNVLIPADSTNGKHSLWAVGSNGNAVRLTVSTFGQAVDPDPSPTPTLAEPTVTSEPTEAATQAPTETATGAPPTETSTLEPSATSTLESTAAPEPTWTPPLDVSPTGEPGLTTTALE